jgi:alginate O-acetyltransferase complex protein AlgI
MVFSSLIFIYLFLPLVLAGYYLMPGRLKNLFLFISSMIFFAWGGASYSLLLLASITFNYFIGKGIAFGKNRKSLLTTGVVLNLSLLAIFKYAAFFLESINSSLKLVEVPPIPIPKIILPIGISFYTFQAMSYLIDVYRKETEVQKSYIKLGLYISLFPQLIAGPIVRYHDIAEQLDKRKSDFERFSGGAIRFTLGLAKKVLIANNMAIIADHIFTSPPEEVNFITAWIGILAYTLQIYYDFAGYSDMAIGLSRMFGFEIPENFNLPYISKSIREFWQRWHISLSQWFMKYLFLPLAYSMSRKLDKHYYAGIRADKVIYMYAAGLTFILCGFWHGAAWNFVVWGAFHGVFLIIEKLGFEKLLKKSWKPLRHLYVLMVIMMSWVLFRAESFDHAFSYYTVLFGFNGLHLSDMDLIMKINSEIIFYAGIGLIGALGFFPWIYKYGKAFYEKKAYPGWIYDGSALLWKMIFMLTVLLLSTGYLVSNSYNPFIYFRF